MERQSASVACVDRETTAASAALFILFYPKICISILSHTACTCFIQLIYLYFIPLTLPASISPCLFTEGASQSRCPPLCCHKALGKQGQQHSRGAVWVLAQRASLIDINLLVQGVSTHHYSYAQTPWAWWGLFLYVSLRGERWSSVRRHTLPSASLTERATAADIFISFLFFPPLHLCCVRCFRWSFKTVQLHTNITFCLSPTISRF